jgi:proline iminopeptidase
VVTVGSGPLAVFSTPAVPEATPLVCVNGGLLYGHEIIWPALAPLADQRQLILFDQRGRGESPPPTDPTAWRIERDADDVAALRVALGVRQWDLLGHSWGAGIAVLAAERDRGGTRRLVLVDSVGPTSEWIADLHNRALQRLEGDPAHRAPLQRMDPRRLTQPDPAVHSAYSRALYPAWFADPAFARAFVPPRSAGRTGAVVLARLRRDGYDWSRSARAVRAQTLVVHGDSDLILCATSHEFTALIPEARFVLIPSCGHMPFWEAPGLFFASVRAFLTEPST